MSETTKQQFDRSIHPRVVGGRQRYDKINTAKPYKGGGKLARAQRVLNIRRNSHSLTLKSLPSQSNPMAFKAPGSMKGRS